MNTKELIKKKCHRFKVNYILNLYNNKNQIPECKEMWIFGSTIDGASKKLHSPKSDIDIGIICETLDLTSSSVKKIHDYVYNNVKPKKFDIVWMDELIKNNDKFLKEIYKGIRII